MLSYFYKELEELKQTVRAPEKSWRTQLERLQPLKIKLWKKLKNNRKNTHEPV